MCFAINVQLMLYFDILKQILLAYYLPKYNLHVWIFDIMTELLFKNIKMTQGTQQGGHIL